MVVALLGSRAFQALTSLATQMRGDNGVFPAFSYSFFFFSSFFWSCGSLFFFSLLLIISLLRCPSVFGEPIHFWNVVFENKFLLFVKIKFFPSFFSPLVNLYSIPHQSPCLCYSAPFLFCYSFCLVSFQRSFFF